MTGGAHPSDPNRQAHFRRNAFAFIGEATLFGLGLMFASTTTILPGFVSQLTGSAVLVGLIISLTEGAWRLPQLLFANWLACKPRKKPYLTRAGLIARPAYLIFAIALCLGVWRSPLLGLSAFFVLHTVMYTALGVDTIVWWDVLAKAIPARRRGRILGASTVLRGFIAIGAGVFISFLLGDSGPGFPINYTVSFAAAGTFFLLSLVAWLFVVEPEEPVTRQRTPWRAYFPQLLTILRDDGALRRLLIVRLLAGFNGFALGFYVLFAIQELGFPTAMIGIFAAVQTVGGILSGVLFGWVSERFGNHRVIQIATAVGMTSPLAALVFLIAEPGASWMPLYSWVFVTIGVFMNADFIGFANLNVDLAPPGERSTYVGLFNTISGLVVIWPAIGGWVLERTSYLALFSVTAAMLMIAHMASWWLPAFHGHAALKKTGMPPLL